MFFADTDFYMPSRILSGKDVITRNSKALALGSKCFIVTGRSSAEKSGALADVIASLLENGIDYEVFNKIEENPQLLVCYEGGKLASEFGADFIIGIGGGSPMDAAKAIAAFAANPQINPDELFNSAALKPSLPIAVVPITAGTGSEANPYSIMTLPDGTKKKTFNSIHSYPKLSFLDAKYLRSLGKRYTLSTALDAFCHCIESYLSPKSTVVSRLLSAWGAKTILDIISIKQDGLTLCDREALLYASCAAGIAINTTGTGFPHPLGYNITMFRALPHGKACALFTEAYIDYNRKCDEGVRLTDAFFAAVGYTRDQICEITNGLCGFNDKLSDDEIELYLSKTADAGNYQNSPYVINKDEMRAIYKKYCQ